MFFFLSYEFWPVCWASFFSSFTTYRLILCLFIRCERKYIRRYVRHNLHTRQAIQRTLQQIVYIIFILSFSLAHSLSHSNLLCSKTLVSCFYIVTAKNDLRSLAVPWKFLNAAVHLHCIPGFKQNTKMVRTEKILNRRFLYAVDRETASIDRETENKTSRPDLDNQVKVVRFATPCKMVFYTRAPKFVASNQEPPPQPQLHQSSEEGFNLSIQKIRNTHTHTLVQRYTVIIFHLRTRPTFDHRSDIVF